MSRHGESIRRFIERCVAKHQSDLVEYVGTTFGISRQAAHRHVRKLVDAGVLEASGATRNRSYSLAVLDMKEIAAPLYGLEEGELWRHEALPFFANVAGRAHPICHHGFTEMVNNAIDHSEGRNVLVRLSRTAATVRILVVDDGIGVFRKIKNALGLEDERHAILQLSKGKFTTDPQRHSGLGVFFTSRAFDEFALASGGLVFTYVTELGDWLGGHSDDAQRGTFVEMVISLSTRRTMQDVYKEYSAPDNPGFSRTTVPVSLAEYGDASLVSRSQAKRVLVGLEKFKEVVFDFKGVATIGQAFADEIFRVYQNMHPDMHLRWINASAAVQQMIDLAKTM